MLPCNCDVGMCTHRPNCRQQRNYAMARSDHSDRDKMERIERLRQRLADAVTHQRLVGVVKGLLDLLADEL